MSEPSVWLIERRFLVTQTFEPIQGIVFDSEKKAKDAIMEMASPHRYRAAEYRRVAEGSKT